MDQSNSDSTGHPVNGAPVDPTPEQPAQPANGGYAVQTVPPLLNQQNPNEAVQPTSNVDTNQKVKKIVLRNLHL